MFNCFLQLDVDQVLHCAFILPCLSFSLIAFLCNPRCPTAVPCLPFCFIAFLCNPCCATAVPCLPFCFMALRYNSYRHAFCSLVICCSYVFSVTSFALFGALCCFSLFISVALLYVQFLFIIELSTCSGKLASQPASQPAFQSDKQTD